MQKNILLIMLTLLCFIPIGAQAQEWCEEESDFYAKILGGANFLQNTEIEDNKAAYQTGYVLSGALGYRLCSDLRFEAEYAFRRNAIRKIHFISEGSSRHGHFQSSSYMANLLWDLPLCSWGCTFWDMQPYVGAGIGYDFQKMHASNSRIVFHQNWNHFSWQLKAGIAYQVFCNTEVALEYNFHQGGCHFYNHSIGLGFVYNFDLFR